MPFQIVVVHRIESPPGGCLVTADELRALELQMSVLSDKIAAVTASVADLKARVEAAVPTPADHEALDAAKVALDGVLPAPVELPPAPEPEPAV